MVKYTPYKMGTHCFIKPMKKGFLACQNLDGLIPTFFMKTKIPPI